MIFAAYLMLCLLVGLCGRRRRSGVVGALFMSLLITPILAFLVLYMTAPDARRAVPKGSGRRGSAPRLL